MTNAQQVKARTDILSLVSETVPLKEKTPGDLWGCCPFHEEKTPSFHVNTNQQVWNCFRCGGGDVFSYIGNRDHLTFPEAVAKLADRAGITETPYSPATAPAARRSPPAPVVEKEAWKEKLQGMLPFTGSPAEAYLRGRGIRPMFPLLSGVHYHPSWYGTGAAVVFPIYDQTGALVAAEWRYLDPGAIPKVRAAGSKKLGVFATPSLPCALANKYLILTESPINALSLAQCGYPALAVCGAGNFVHWLPAVCPGKTVIIAFDPDPAGDHGAQTYCEALAKFTIPCADLLPRTPSQDWNDYLQQYGLRPMQSILLQTLGTDQTP